MYRSSLLPTTMTSADFSYANAWHRDLPSACPASSGVRHLSFSLSLPHLQVDTFAPTGFVKMCSLTPINMPLYVVHVLQYRPWQSPRRENPLGIGGCFLMKNIIFDQIHCGARECFVVGEDFSSHINKITDKVKNFCPE